MPKRRFHRGNPYQQDRRTLREGTWPPIGCQGSDATSSLKCTLLAIPVLHGWIACFTLIIYPATQEDAWYASVSNKYKWRNILILILTFLLTLKIMIQPERDLNNQIPFCSKNCCFVAVRLESFVAQLRLLKDRATNITFLGIFCRAILNRS